MQPADRLAYDSKRYQVGSCLEGASMGEPHGGVLLKARPLSLPLPGLEPALPSMLAVCPCSGASLAFRACNMPQLPRKRCTRRCGLRTAAARLQLP
jgi:hypothetical protein